MSIYEKIKRSIKDGRLPDSFIIPAESSSASQALPLTNGADDGIKIFHTGMDFLNSAQQSRLNKIADAVAEGDLKRASRLLDSYVKKNSAYDSMAALNSYIKKKLNQKTKVYFNDFAVRILLNSDNRQCVRIAIIIAGAVSPMWDDVKDILRTLALCSDFTYYVINVMKTWENGNGEIFDIARHTNGWGKIHAVKALKPETEEIKGWLLTQGVVNNVSPGYSALNCFEKSDMFHVLKADRITADTFQGCSRIMAALMSSNGTPGIYLIDNADDLFMDFLRHCKDHELDLSDYMTILSIFEFEVSDRPVEDVVECCREVLLSDECLKTIKEALKRGDGVTLAESMCIDYKPALLRALDDNSPNAYFYISRLIDDPDYIDKALAICLRNLPLDTMTTGPENILGFSPQYEENLRFQLCIQALENHPCKGIELMKAALNMPLVNNRFAVIKVAEAWTAKMDKPLQETCPELYQAFLKAQGTEVRDDLIQQMQFLTDGNIPLPEKKLYI